MVVVPIRGLGAGRRRRSVLALMAASLLLAPAAASAEAAGNDTATTYTTTTVSATTTTHMCGNAANFHSVVVPRLLGDVSADATACQGRSCALGTLLANALLAGCDACHVAVLPASVLTPDGLDAAGRLVAGGSMAPGHLHGLVDASARFEVRRVTNATFLSWLTAAGRFAASDGYPQMSQNIQVLVDGAGTVQSSRWRSADGCSSFGALESDLPGEVLVGGPAVLFDGVGGLAGAVESPPGEGLAYAACDALLGTPGLWDLWSDGLFEFACGTASNPVHRAGSWCPSAFSSWTETEECFSLRLLHTAEVAGASLPTGSGPCYDPTSGNISAGCVGGAERRGKFFESVRQEVGASVLVVDAGNHYFGGDFAASHSGAADGHLLNLQNYTVVATNFRDFQGSAKAEVASAVNSMLQGYGGPVVMTNVDVAGADWDSVRDAVSRYHVATLGTRKVGIIGVMSDEVSTKSIVGTDWQINPQSEDASVLSVDVAAAVSQLREHEEVGLVVALLGLNVQEALAVLQNSVGIDVAALSIISAGDLAGALYGDVDGFDWAGVHQIAVESKVVPGKRILVVSSPPKGTQVGSVTVDISARAHAVRWHGGLVTMDESVDDGTQGQGDLAAAVKTYYEEAQQALGATIVELLQPVEYSTDDRYICWSQDCPITRLLADAMFSFGDSVCHFAMISTGGIQGGLSAGPVTLNELEGVMPYNNNIVVIAVNGSVLKEALKHSASECADGGFGHFSGLRFAQAVVSAEAGSEEEQGVCKKNSGTYVSAEICKKGSYTAGAGCTEWLRIENGQIYTFATTSWLYQWGGDGYGAFFKTATLIQTIGWRRERTVVSDWLQHPDFPAAGYPALSSITQDCAGNVEKEGWDAGCRVIDTAAQPDADITGLCSPGFRFHDSSGECAQCPTALSPRMTRRRACPVTLGAWRQSRARRSAPSACRVRSRTRQVKRHA
ncbi:unnamed protein product [Prorocentrum cordatum]|uniref:5'-Nucleotidase C-terminal domain-containing protein n=1 Tax=Prorocentrum cordatum TaxID=2364126 RepID=A0ABN9XA91_9DINO|nr:unnamed protein product [Polarella glacialis]